MTPRQFSAAIADASAYWIPCSPMMTAMLPHLARREHARGKSMSLPSSVDVAIIGAGAAGLGAANALKNSGLSVIVLEARNRVGGRAHTIQAAPDVTFDVGCGWLHSADQNSFVKIAEQLKFRNQQEPAALARARLRQGVSARPTATTSSARSTPSTIAPRKPLLRPSKAAATAPPVSVSSPATAGTR